MLQRLTFNGARGWTGITRFVRYVQCDVDAADQSIALFCGGAFFGLLLPGDEVELEEMVSDCRVVPVVAGLSGVVAAGTSRLSPNTVSGEVDVDSGWRTVLRERQTSGTVDVAAGAGLFAAVIIDGQGFAYTLRRLQVQATPAARCFAFTFGDGPPPIGPTNGGHANKLPGGPGEFWSFRTYQLSAATFNSLRAAATVITGLGAPFWAGRAAVETQEVIGTSPVVMRPGFGVAVICQAAASTLTVNVDMERARA